MMAPNSLRLLDEYGIYARLRERGYCFDVVAIQDTRGSTREGFYLGSREFFGYDALRIYRNALLDELERACADRDIQIVYNKKFSEIFKEDDQGVEFGFQDGSKGHAGLLIAADGIHSKVRKVLFPQIEPVYNGILTIAGAVKASSLVTDSPEHQIIGPTMFEGKNGAFLLTPQLPDGGELLAATGRPYRSEGRDEWTRLSQERSFHISFLREGYADRQPIVQRAVDNIIPGSTFIWPQYTLPRLPGWTSDRGRVVLIGDAAHAMPPTSGQGANQAFEDGWTLARVLAETFNTDTDSHAAEATTTTSETLRAALHKWYAQRQQRIDRVLALTRQMTNLRRPLEEQQRLNDGEVWKSLADADADAEAVDKEQARRDAAIEQWSWLYVPDLDGSASTV